MKKIRLTPFIFRGFSLIILLFFCSRTFAQQPSETFFSALDLYKTDKLKSKPMFLAAVREEPLFQGSYHFLGVIATLENKSDSAVFYFKRSLSLNETNINHTKEMTYARLMEEYKYRHDFANAYKTGTEALALFPDNKSITREFVDMCIWAAYIYHNGLDSAYLSRAPLKEYVVNSVSQEYLIVRTLKTNDYGYSSQGQALIFKGKDAFDILHCITGPEKEKIDLSFKLNWDFATEFGGKSVDTDKVYADKNNPAWQRLGAHFIKDPRADLKKEIDNL